MDGDKKGPVVCYKPTCTEEAEDVKPPVVIKIDPDARYIILIHEALPKETMNELCYVLDEWWNNDTPFLVLGAGGKKVEFHRVEKGQDQCLNTTEIK